MKGKYQSLYDFTVGLRPSKLRCRSLFVVCVAVRLFVRSSFACSLVLVVRSLKWPDVVCGNVAVWHRTTNIPVG